MIEIPRKDCNVFRRVEKFQSEWHSVDDDDDDDDDDDNNNNNNNNNNSLSLQFTRKTELLFGSGNQ